mmetsp:Transcript_11210/g.17612  ORF Transcript_11210/g.17612 Transcript_11210/m.17612 type:complete len:112 (-) Transcript_11210:156-491(-)|eukprot:CAMPEP_0184328618 /NCGR_PEP_ID=MMETSP1049-20130417/143718_1 /TAXON_ID=77928 /ORGANISM="Proteomonas sulcata, Strain CCMP704" /LENGTH=111 /DNA_ID=CAMNT_0026650941 /DNA_START=618 /DNA_END=953 /DNA_ORIENTATION=-
MDEPLFRASDALEQSASLLKEDSKCGAGSWIEEAAIALDDSADLFQEYAELLCAEDHADVGPGADDQETMANDVGQSEDLAEGSAGRTLTSAGRQLRGAAEGLREISADWS